MKITSFLVIYFSFFNYCRLHHYLKLNLISGVCVQDVAPQVEMFLDFLIKVHCDATA